MEILKGRVRWNEGTMLDPELILLVDRIPADEEMRYEERRGFYFAEKDGYVKSYYSVKSGKNNTVNSGIDFVEVKMKDGKWKTLLVAPWETHQGYSLVMGFPQCFKVLLTDDPSDFEAGFPYRKGYVTVELIDKYLSRIYTGRESFKDGQVCLMNAKYHPGYGGDLFKYGYDNLVWLDIWVYDSKEVVYYRKIGSGIQKWIL